MNKVHAKQRGDSFVKNLSPSLSKMIHNFAGWACQPEQDPQIPEDDMDEFFPCIDIAESEDEGSLVLIPEEDTAKVRDGIVQQDEILYLHSTKKDELVQEIKTKKIIEPVEEPKRPDSYKKVQDAPNPPLADGLFAASPSNPVIPVLNRITANPVDDRESTSYWFIDDRDTANIHFEEIKVARRDLSPPPPEKKAKLLERIQAYVVRKH